ncbi:MAG: tetratricopeptide repeat protein [Geminicoccaceae bacterium]
MRGGALGRSTFLLAGVLLLANLIGCASEPKVTRPVEPKASVEDVDSLVRLGDYLQERGELSTAIALYQRAANSSEDVGKLIKLGRALANAGATERAAGAFRRAVSLQPDNPDALLGLGTAFLQLGEIEKSIFYLEQLVEQGDGTDSVRYAALGAALDLAGDHKRAVAIYKEGLEHAPGSLDLKSNLALSFALNDRPQEAIDMMRAVTNSLDAERPHHRNLVLVLALAGKHREAVTTGLRLLGEAETQDVLAQASSARGLTNGADRARAIGST